MSIQRVVGCGLSLILLAVSLLSVGCGGGQSDGYSGPRGQVAGKVTIDGQPLAKGCQVYFQADKGGYTAAGVVGDDGQYTVAYAGGSGLPTGDYRVQLSPPLVVDAAPATVDPTQMAGRMKISPKMKSSEEDGPFPAKYRSMETSGMKFRVEANQNTANFDLTK
jgi:hypothetical protein